MEEIKKMVSDAKRDVSLTTNYLLQCTIMREIYTIDLLKDLFEKLGIEEPDFSYDFSALSKEAKPTDEQKNVLTMEEKLRKEIELLRKEHRWIPITEMLPPPGIKVLCGSDRDTVIKFGRLSKDGKWYTDDSRDDAFWITHWKVITTYPDGKQYHELTMDDVPSKCQ